MKKLINIKLVKFYLWVGLSYFILGLCSTVGDYPGKFFPLFFDHVWAVIYVIALNFILFEYTVPFILRKRKTIIYNILLAIPLLFFYMILYSYGAYEWRSLGSQLRIYTQLKVYPSMDEALEAHMAYSVGSVFVFGVARHIYNYLKLKRAEQQLRIE
jgi:hypothetical protein